MTELITSDAHASLSNEGIVKLSVAPVDINNPIAVGDNDPRLGSGSAIGNLDGGVANSVYGGITAIDCGGA
jgi:hypothetical protein